MEIQTLNLRLTQGQLNWFCAWKNGTAAQQMKSDIFATAWSISLSKLEGKNTAHSCEDHCKFSGFSNLRTDVQTELKSRFFPYTYIYFFFHTLLRAFSRLNFFKFFAPCFNRRSERERIPLCSRKRWHEIARPRRFASKGLFQLETIHSPGKFRSFRFTASYTSWGLLTCHSITA
jgi:hypothetical protein